MKTLLTIALVGLCLIGCKKDQPYRNIQLKVTIPKYTTYNINVTDAGSPTTDLENQSQNSTNTITARSGDKLAVTFNFSTMGSQYGQGTAVFSYNSQTLLTINGGSGNETVTVP